MESQNYMPQQQPQQQPLPQQPQPQQQPLSQQQSQQQPAEPQKIHVHHSYIWLGGLRIAFYMLVVSGISFASSLIGVFAELAIGGQGELFLIVGVILLVMLLFITILGISLLVRWWSYKHLFYQLTPEEFSLHSGIFNKQRVHVPYQRVQSVDQKATLFQRIFGVCTVSIDTAGGSNNKAITIPYVSKTQAEQLRYELFARKQYVVAGQAAPVQAAPAPGVAAPVQQPLAQQPGNILDAPAEIWQNVNGIFGGAGADMAPVSYEYGMTNKELIFTGLSNNTAFMVIVVGVIGLISQLFGLLDEFAAPAQGSWEDVALDAAFSATPQLIAMGAGIFVVIMIVLWALSAVGSCISYGGFKARRRGNRIEVEYGLLQHQFQGVDVDRVQSVVVKQSFIRRILGYCEVSLGKIDAAAADGDTNKNTLANQGLIIHPFVKVSRVPEILAGIIPEFADVPAQTTPVAKVALRRALIRRGIIQGSGFWLAIVVALCVVLVNLFVVPEVPTDPDMALLMTFANPACIIGFALAFTLFVVEIIGAVLWAKSSGFAFNQQFMQVTNGGFARETVSFPRKKIQFGYTKTNPFQRSAHTATITAVTAAGVGGTHVRLIDAREEDAQAWLAWVKPRRNVVG